MDSIHDDSGKALSNLNQLTDDLVEFKLYNVVSWEGGKGATALMNHIQRLSRKYQVKKHEILAWGQNSAEDTAFALVEAALEDGSTVYQIFKVGILLDETTNCVVDLLVRGHLSEESISHMSHAPWGAKPITPFPKDRLVKRTEAFNENVAHRAAAAWCKARCTGESSDLVKPVFDLAHFHLWDAYGVLPVLCDPTKRARADACVLDGSKLDDVINAAKQNFDIRCHLVESAASPTHNLCFNQWYSELKDQESNRCYVMEGVEVMLFDAEGRVSDIWMFRDPTDQERNTIVEPTMSTST